MASYTDSHRAFLQAMLAEPYIDIALGQKILAAIKTVENGGNETISPESILPKEVYAYISKISDAITPFNFVIRDMLDQEEGDRIWALVNAADDEIIRNSTQFSADEIAFFKRLLDAMFDKHNTREAEIMAIKGMEALTLCKNPQVDKPATQSVSQGPPGAEADGATTATSGTQMSGPGMGLTKKEAEEALLKFNDLRWLDRDKKGFYFLTTRAILELELYLMETYNVPEEAEEGDTPGPPITRIKHCNGCKYIQTIGLRCSNLDCDFRCHEHCATNLFKDREKTCPVCKAGWTGENFVGPKAAHFAGTSALRNARQSSSGASQQRTQRSESVIQPQGDNEQEISDIEEEIDVVNTTKDDEANRKRKRQPSIKVSKRTRVSDPSSATSATEEQSEEEENEDEEIPNTRRQVASSQVNGITRGVRRAQIDQDEEGERREEEVGIVARQNRGRKKRSSNNVGIKSERISNNEKKVHEASTEGEDEDEQSNTEEVKQENEIEEEEEEEEATPSPPLPLRVARGRRGRPRT